MTPSIGRIVIFETSDPSRIFKGATAYPAIITEVVPGLAGEVLYVNLTTFPPSQPPRNEAAVFLAGTPSAEGQNCSWRWPERV